VPGTYNFSCTVDYENSDSVTTMIAKTMSVQVKPFPRINGLPTKIAIIDPKNGQKLIMPGEDKDYRYKGEGSQSLKCEEGKENTYRLFMVFSEHNGTNSDGSINWKPIATKDVDKNSKTVEKGLSMRFADLKNKRKAITLPEVLVAAVVSALFFMGLFSLFRNGQKTVTKSSWINNATKEESIFTRKIYEASRTSSYPSTLGQNIVKVAENPSYFAVLPAGSGAIDIKTLNAPVPILAFPICTEETIGANSSASQPGTIRWIELALTPSQNKGYAALLLNSSAETQYTTSPPNYAANYKEGQYAASTAPARRETV